ncbi:phosphoglycolate phosphatase [Stieleria maiorica]|uniref:Phosphoglycolate phosphatase n=1 Tax=Stieleria maiorica TaxID=2795974 RepID=A0A5B9M9A2_9BACT|nr:HAD hydrolase family protein [Stieleria maiorica]QEF97811.1 phosphoglycolate phosphatase [Stieleria maiorica]
MQLRVIATDYDGTIAQDGVLDPAVREAIAVARKRGVMVVIVTGRILSELRHVAGCLDFVDGVVAENGAVVAFPNGHISVLGSAPPLSLISKLTHRGIDFKVGRCVVEMDAEYADVAIELIRELELPLAITFNRGRMMLLPASISKSVGLRELLGALGVSVHNAVGIGDAENDHELIACCEHGVAVAWGSERLKQVAGHVIEGHGPAAVGEYIKRISADIRLPPETMTHRKLILEEIEGKAPFEIAIRGRNVLVAGDTKSGKSWLAGLLVEQQILQGYTVYAFDPEGDYSSLATLPNTVVLGAGRLLPHGDDLKMLLQQGLSVVLNLSHLEHHQKREYIQQHLPLVAQHRRERGFPHRILLDECHYFLDGTDGVGLLDSQLDGYTLVTYLPSLLPANVLKLVDVVAVTRLAEQKEVDALRNMLDDTTFSNVDSHDWYDQLANLGITEAALLPPTEEVAGRLRRFVVAPRLTTHVRHRTKYFDIPVPEGRQFVFTENGRPVGETAATLRELSAAASRTTPSVLAGHNRHHDISRWIASLFCDHDLANDVRQLESKHKREVAKECFATDLAEIIERRYESTHQ